ncbi:MAG: carboxypeptidase-like regulatory domain-containing protein [Marinifilaceae bacterium]
MQKKLLLFQFLFCVICMSVNAQTDSISISGVVRDFQGNPVDSCLVELFHANFKTAYQTHTDKEGRYSLQVSKGNYLALGALKMSEYPLAGSTLPKDKQRLEFWAWNLIAKENLTINIQYHRLEVYGVNIFRVQGANPGYTIYCRPMSLSRGFSNPELSLDQIDLCPDPKELEVKVEVNGIPVNVNMKQKVKEYVSSGICNAYLLHVDLPRDQVDKPYDIFHIEMTDLANGDRGESIIFKEKANNE